ncbi:MAG: methyltransferase domain-containing protein [Candidatus Moranbacteria bacterium]|nr:methyltransferase domain-containing protein [Candidatus Moranbacteria bacterium]MDQ5976532.1 hypothetical protein [Patescibacteria group bacterium]
MGKIFGEIPQNIVRPEKNQDELIPFLSERARNDYEKSVGHEMALKDFNVWVVQTEASRFQSQNSIESLIATSQISLNTGDSKSSNERFVAVSAVPQNELHHKISNTFKGYGKVTPNLLPDLVIVMGDMGYDDTSPAGDLARAYLEFEMKPIRDIRRAAEATLHHHFPTGEKLTGDWDVEFFQIHVLGKNYHELLLKKHEMTEEIACDLIASSLFNDTDHALEISGRAFDTYARTKDEHLLRKITTDGRIRHAVKKLQRSFVLTHLIEQHRQSKEGKGSNPGEFQNEEEYIAYVQTLIQKTDSVAKDMHPEQLRTAVYTSLMKMIDREKQNYLTDIEFESMEDRLIQPIIVSVGKSQKYQEASFKSGVDAALPELGPTDMEKLVRLAKRIRTSPASMATERLRRNKSEFYHSVVDQIEDRSKETADTEKELGILSSLFKKIDAKTILDVGCGYGRLAKPLAKEGFDVTGIDASQALLTKAKEMKGKTKNLHYAKGDIIDYTGSVPKESFDAVYYGWHSFLEAYGLGNALASLRSARHALKPNGVITFDQPARTNPELEEGWYGDAEHGYLAYLMDEEELKFMLRLAGFEDVHILHWTTKPSALYPEGMQKISVVARKPSLLKIEKES